MSREYVIEGGGLAQLILADRLRSEGNEVLLLVPETYLGREICSPGRYLLTGQDLPLAGSQEEKIWRNFLGKEVIPESNSCELYFEERNIEAFVERLERLYPSIRYVNRLMAHSWGQKVIRFYDLDGNLIEVGTPV